MPDQTISRRDVLVKGAVAGAGLAAGGALITEAGPTQAHADVRVGASPVSITVLEHQEINVKLMKRQIPRFEAAMAAKGTPITVNLQVGPTPDNDFQTQLTVAYAAGNGPDVASFAVSWTPDYILANFLKDITPYVRAWPDWSRYWYPSIRNASMVNGKLYYLPRDGTVFSLFYRKDILDAHGIPTAQPKTWDDLLNVAREIKKKTGKFAFCFPAGVQWGGGTFDEGFIHLMLGSGSPIYDEAKRKWVVKSPGLLRVFQFYATAAKEGLLPVKWLLSPNPWVPIKYKGFVNGDVLMTTSGSWAWEFDWGAQGAAPIPDIFNKVATWQFPAVNGKPFTTGGIGWSWAIANRSTQPQAAFEFIKFMSSGAGLADHLISSGAVSPRTDLATTQPSYGKLKFLVDSERTLTTARTFIPRPGEAKVQQFIAEATQSLITGSASPDSAMSTFASKVTDGLGAGMVEQM